MVVLQAPCLHVLIHHPGRHVQAPPELGGVVRANGLLACRQCQAQGFSRQADVLLDAGEPRGHAGSLGDGLTNQQPGADMSRVSEDRAAGAVASPAQRSSLSGRLQAAPRGVSTAPSGWRWRRGIGCLGVVGHTARPEPPRRSSNVDTPDKVVVTVISLSNQC
jgi:hypothetical protein